MTRARAAAALSSRDCRRWRRGLSGRLSQVVESYGCRWALFDVFDQQVRDVIADQAKLVPGWPAEQQLSERVWYLLAATGGRPRDVSSMLDRLCDVDLAFEPYPDELLGALFVKEPDECFQRYLLASMLGIHICRVLSFDHAVDALW
jgi:hypothetical protein